jgi:hypothetical protein
VRTAAMIRSLLEREGVAELDFGRGDDANNALWSCRRRQRIGVMLANPRGLAGLAALGRHRLGRPVLHWLRGQQGHFFSSGLHPPGTR